MSQKFLYVYRISWDVLKIMLDEEIIERFVFFQCTENAQCQVAWFRSLVSFISLNKAGYLILRCKTAIRYQLFLWGCIVCKKKKEKCKIWLPKINLFLRCLKATLVLPHTSCTRRSFQESKWTPYRLTRVFSKGVQVDTSDYNPKISKQTRH